MNEKSENEYSTDSICDWGTSHISEIKACGSDWKESYEISGYYYKQQVLGKFLDNVYEIHVFRNQETKESICSMWDPFEELFLFLCKNDYDTFQCVRQMASLTKDISSVERDHNESCS